jgi:hypothetical protein
LDEDDSSFLALLATMAYIVSALAVSVPMLIAGATTKGLAAATQLSHFYTIAELVPMKQWYLANGFLYLFQIPGARFSPAVS